MWQVTHDMFGGVNILSKFQLPSSYRLWFMILWRSGGKGWLSQSVSQLMNDEAVYRTAPATPGLLKKGVTDLTSAQTSKVCFKCFLQKYVWRFWKEKVAYINTRLDMLGLNK